MASLRFADVQSRPTEFLDFTSVTLDEFQALVPPFEATFHAPMAAWRLDGQPRTARRFTVYQNCPLPPPEDRLFFLLTYLKTYALHVVRGRLFGMGQSKANQWIHVLLPALLAALRTLSDAPCPLSGRPGATARRLGGRRRHRGRPAGGVSTLSHRTSRRAGLPPCAHYGTERRIVSP
jgi:DDE superfamily endonuclease